MATKKNNRKFAHDIIDKYLQRKYELTFLLTVKRKGKSLKSNFEHLFIDERNSPPLFNQESADFKDLVKVSSSFKPSSGDWASPNSFTIALPTITPSAPQPATYEHSNISIILYNWLDVMVCDQVLYLFHVLRFWYTKTNCNWFFRNLWWIAECEASKLQINAF